MSQVSILNNAILPPGAGEVLSVTGNSGGAVHPDGTGNIDLVGSGVLTFAGNPGTHTLTGSISGSVATRFDEDSGSATPSAGVLNVKGAHGLNTLGASNNVTVAINNAITLGDLTPIGAGADALLATTGDITLNVGNINLRPLASTTTSGIITIGNGLNVLPAFSYFASFSNIFVGANSGAFNASIMSGTFNTALGFQSLFELTSGSYNVTLGAYAGPSTTGSSNINIGFQPGGTASESNTLRIGKTGGGIGAQNNAYIGGIQGVNVGSVASVVSISGDHLGSTVITAGTGITVTPGANTITIASGVIITYTPVSTTPYVVLLTDNYIGVTTSSIAITIQLPNAPATGSHWTIKDSTGNAATHNITVTTVGGVVNIDGGTSFTMNTAFEAINVIFNGSAYEIY